MRSDRHLAVVATAGVFFACHRANTRRAPMAQKRIWVSVFGAFAAAIAVSVSAHAQTWPTRPVTMVVPFAAGGPIDTVARIMAPSLSETLGQSVIIENVGGAGGMTGALRVAKAPPDGYQFVLGNVGTHAVSQSLPKSPPYDVLADFAPVGLFADLSLVLVVRRDLPTSNLAEFIAYARANQDKMQFGSASVGSATHLACALLNAAVGVNIVHVPYRGGAPAMQDLIGGRIDYLCLDTPVVIPMIESGQIKAIAILTRGRSASLPNLPSAQEQGLTGFEAANWASIYFPKGTPAAIVQKLNAAISAAVDNPAVRKRMNDVGIDPVTPDRRSPEYLATFTASEIAKWGGAIKAAGVAAE
jgi:tripartite-type tricarboxylate transporter receptor subunit TctC